MTRHHTVGTAPAAARPWWKRPVWAFTRHYLEMIAAMLLGMAVLYPLWMLATGSASDASWLHRTDVETTVMATAMAAPMVAWMLVRGHTFRPIAEMTLAMYAGFWILYPFLWTGTVGEMGVMMVGHVLMPGFMLVAMLLRAPEYAHVH
ncbi:hypothetical protein [Mumia zhuanghuii]|uniref:Flagellar biosynthetic protein FliP n=1 Tax=Mumia zhuanghuii TaxID=2585211 RepID=A0A5C4MLY4_9ACTN|nr:hypothetical protein [Mumia zhuanghuii]TNC42461.1 hypothetical protein FHE65_21345 [Mumia zhuanghuii]TNC43692.1 hypothetical protein FHE65_17805 [Mumia zhuanghuii]